MYACVYVYMYVYMYVYFILRMSVSRAYVCNCVQLCLLYVWIHLRLLKHTYIVINNYVIHTCILWMRAFHDC